MEEFRRRQAILRQRELGMVEMKPTGGWGLTRFGRDFLDDIELLRELDDRPDAAQATSPTRASRAATPPTSARRGDDGPTAREARSKGSR